MPDAPDSDQPLSVGAYLRDWLELQRTRLQPSTVKSYSGNVRRYLEPHLGDVPLHELGVLQLERLWTRLMTCGGQGGRPLSRRSVEYAAATLRSALSDAVRTGIVDGHARLKATKTLRSRSIRIDVNVIEALGRRRRQQQLQRETAGNDGWHDRWGLVFTGEDGTYLAPMTVTSAFRWRVRRVDVPTIRLHDLRHSHATLLLEAGVPVKVVSEQLGHASVSMTLDVYAHVLPAMEADAVQRFTAHLYGTA